LRHRLRPWRVTKKGNREKINHFNKRIDDEKKMYKKIEYENMNLAE